MNAAQFILIIILDVIISVGFVFTFTEYFLPEASCGTGVLGEALFTVVAVFIVSLIAAGIVLFLVMKFLSTWWTVGVFVLIMLILYAIKMVW